MGNNLNARLKFVLLTIVTLVVGAAFLWVWFGWVANLNKWNAGPIGGAPEGVLLLSYALVDAQSDSASLFPALFDFSTSQTTFIDVEQNGESLSGIHHSLSSNGEWSTFIDSETPDGSWPSALYRVRSQNEDLPAALLAATMKTPSVSQVKAMFPDISNDGDILYMSVPTITGLSTDDFYVKAGAAWDIIHLDQANEAKVLAQGSHPKWLGNEGFLFLKYDGVYYYSLSDQQETRLVQSLSLVGPSHRLVLSEDGTQALFIEATAGVARLFDVTQDTRGISLHEQEPITVNATSGAFSPNSKYIAMTVLPANDSNVSVVVYDNEGNTVYGSALPDASPTFTSLQAWVY